MISKHLKLWLVVGFAGVLAACGTPEKEEPAEAAKVEDSSASGSGQAEDSSAATSGIGSSSQGDLNPLDDENSLLSKQPS